MKQLTIVFTCLILMTACKADKKENIEANTPLKTETKDTKQETMKPIFELAINQSKENGHQTFLDTRAKFVEVLGKEDATLNEGKWLPFFTVIPDMDLGRVLIGMTEWNSFEGFGEAAARLVPQEEGKNYFASFSPLAYALLEPVDGKPFDMETIKKDGLVIEFAIRKGKTNDAFGDKRNTFFNSLNNYEGYQFAREFKVHKLDEKGIPSLAENTQAVIIVWDNAEKFQAAATPIFASKEYADFAGVIDVETYFATSPTK